MMWSAAFVNIMITARFTRDIRKGPQVQAVSLPRNPSRHRLRDVTDESILEPGKKRNVNIDSLSPEEQHY